MKTRKRRINNKRRTKKRIIQNAGIRITDNYITPDKYEENLKKVNLKKYNKIMDNIKDTVEEKKYPGYITLLLSNQINGLIGSTLTSPDDNDPNKLRLIMS